MSDEGFMREALRLAQAAADEGEVPVGCVVVRGGEIVGRGRKRREGAKSALAHAEIEAVCNARAVPDVRRGDHQRAHPARGLRRERAGKRLLRLSGRSVHAPMQPEAGDRAGRAGGGVLGDAERVFQKPAREAKRCVRT